MIDIRELIKLHGGVRGAITALSVPDSPRRDSITPRDIAKPPAGKVFGDIYQTGQAWGVGPWDSGTGSSPKVSKPYVQFIAAELRAFPAGTRILDVGAGDGRVLAALGRSLRCGNVPGRGKYRFYAVDCVEGILARGKSAAPFAEWTQADAFKDNLPPADVVLLRDVCNHLPSVDVIRLIQKLRKHAKRLYVSHDAAGAQPGADIPLGGHRPLDLYHPEFAGAIQSRRVLDYGDKAVWQIDTDAAGTQGEPYEHRIHHVAAGWCGKIWGQYLRSDAPPPGIWPDTLHFDAPRRAFIGALASFRDTLDQIPPPKDAKGDGIVIVGAGRYWLMSCLSAHMCREHGWKGPIQIWHRGWELPGPASWLPKGVEVIDANNFASQNRIHLRLDFRDRQGWDDHRMKGGWIVKSFAVRNCPFRRVLFLDADAYPAANPAKVFQEMGKATFGYWPDYHQGSLRWQCFPDGRPHDRTGAIQGGSLLFDRGSVEGWQLLRTWNRIQQWADYFYRFGWGDQEMLWLAGGVIRGIKEGKKMGQVQVCKDAAWIHKVGDLQAIVHRLGQKVWADLPINWSGEYLPGEAKYRELTAYLLKLS